MKTLFQNRFRFKASYLLISLAWDRMFRDSKVSQSSNKIRNHFIISHRMMQHSKMEMAGLLGLKYYRLLTMYHLWWKST